MDDPDGRDIEHVLGLDLGQSSDPSALTVTRKITPYRYAGEEDRQRMPGTQVTGDTRYAVVWIERFELGTPYPEVVRRTLAIQEAPETGPSPELVMDATGIGAPVVDSFREHGAVPVEIVFTSGDSVKRDGSTYSVPKVDLATTVQSLLQTGRLTIAEDLKHAGQLAQEMRRFRVKVSDSGHARFEHANESDTDDVLLSLACAVWYGQRGHSGACDPSKIRSAGPRKTADLSDFRS